MSSMYEIFWSPLNENTDPGHPAKELENWLKKNIHAPSAKWFLTMDGPPPRKTSAERVAHAVLTDEQVSTEHAIAMNNFLVSQTIRLNVEVLSKQEKMLNLPLVAFKIMPERSPLGPKFWDHVGALRSLQNQIKERCRNFRGLPSEEQLSMLAVSAIVYGDLLDTRALLALIRKIGETVPTHRKIPFLELELKNDRHKYPELRRWYPDPMTWSMFLMLDPSEQTHNLDEQRLGQIVQKYWLRGPKTPRYRSLRTLLGGIADARMLDTPPFLVKYARGQFPSHAIHHRQLLRLDSGKGEQKSRNKSAPPQPVPILIPREWRQFSATELLSKLSNIEVPGADDSTAGKTIQSFQRLIIEWSESLLYEVVAGLEQRRARAAGYRARSVKSVVNNANTLNRFFAPHLEKLIDSGANWNLDELVRAVLAQTNSIRHEANLARLTFQFINWLERYRGFSGLEDPSVLDARHTPSVVDANAIREHEFQLLKRTLLGPSRYSSELAKYHPDFPRLVAIAAILGYRTGLRASEIQYLRSSDVATNGLISVLIVMPHLDRILKSLAGYRQIPISTALPPDELKLLREWVATISADTKNSRQNPYIFTLPRRFGAGRNMVSRKDLFPPIIRALQDITGDQSLRFHHFRHSCASNMFLACMTHLFGMPPVLQAELPESSIKWIEERGPVIYKTLIGNSKPSKSVLYAIAQQMGHAAPKISLNHYIHAVDMIGCHVRDKRNNIVTSHIAQITGLSVQRLHRHHSESKEKLNYALLTGLPTSPGLICLSRKTPRQALLQPSKWRPTIENIVDVLSQHALHGASAEAIAEKYDGLTAASIQRLAANAQAVQNEFSESRLPWLTDRSGESPILTTVPIVPRNAVDRTLADTVFDAIWSASQSNPEGTLSGIMAALALATDPKSSFLVKSPTQSNQLFPFLGALGISMSGLRIRLLHGDDIEPGWKKRARAFWSEEAAISKRYLRTYRRRAEHTFGDHGHLAVDLLRPGAQPQEKSPGALLALLCGVIALINSSQS